MTYIWDFTYTDLHFSCKKEIDFPNGKMVESKNKDPQKW